MTYRKDLSGDNDYSSMNDIDLANAYLFDELPENDNEIESTITKGKNTEEDIKQLLTADIVLLKYFLFKDEKTKASKLVEQIEEKIKLTKSELNIKGIQSAFYATKFQIELLSLIK